MRAVNLSGCGSFDGFDFVVRLMECGWSGLCLSHDPILNR